MNNIINWNSCKEEKCLFCKSGHEWGQKNPPKKLTTWFMDDPKDQSPMISKAFGYGTYNVIDRVLDDPFIPKFNFNVYLPVVCVCIILN